MRDSNRLKKKKKRKNEKLSKIVKFQESDGQNG